MKAKLGSLVAILLCVVVVTACTPTSPSPSIAPADDATQEPTEAPAEDPTTEPATPEPSAEPSPDPDAGASGDGVALDGLTYNTADENAPAVYMTTDISPEGLMAVYEALGLIAQGENVAVKISTGEPGGNHFLSPDLIGGFVQSVDGTIVECNTSYGGQRASTAMHYQVAEDHGFTAIAPVVIMDEEESMSIPVEGGSRLTEDIVGARFSEFDFHVVLSHFKGHGMAGFGGALKNLSIGYASSEGKGIIHSGGAGGSGWGDQDGFLMAMAEAAKGVVDYADGNILYINVMNHLSVDCDCDANPAAPTMADIAILASLDPVALDQACVDLVYAAPDGQDLVERMESRNGILTVEHAAEINLGSREYRLVSIDN